MAKGDQEKANSAINQQRTGQNTRLNSYLDNSAKRLGSFSNSGIGATGGLYNPGGTYSPGGTAVGRTPPPGTPSSGTAVPANGVYEGGLRGNVSQGRDELKQLFGDYFSTGGVSENTRNALEDSPNSIAGRIQAPDYSEASRGYKNLMETGGVDLSNVNDTISKLKDFAATGGMSAADKENILRPLYYEMEKTGGYSDKDLANIKKESNSVVPSFYSNMQDQMNRQRAASGYGAGFGSAAKSMAREGAIQSGNQALRTDVGLQESVRQGKMSGADAIQRGQLGISDITGRNTLGAYGTAGNLGLGGQSLVQQGKIAGTGGLSDIATRQGQFDLGRSELASNNVRGLAGLTQSGQQFGASGLAGIYGGDMNMAMDEAKNQLAAMGLDAGTQNQLLGLLTQNANNPGKWQQIYNNILSGVGAASGVMTGLGDMK